MRPDPAPAGPESAPPELDVEALGSRIGVVVDDRGLRTTLRRLLRDCLAEPSAADHPGRTDALATGAATVRATGTGPWLVSGANGGTTTSRAPAALTEVLAAVNVAAVLGTPHLAFHAAVLSRPGRTLVLPASSGAGKSTLTAALLTRGWDYVSDESLCLRWQDGELVAYPRPLALSAWSQLALHVTGGEPGEGERYYAATDLGACVDPRPRKVTDVILLSREDGPPTLVPHPRQQVVSELLHRAFTVHHDPARALLLLSGVVSAADTWLLRLGDPRAAADLVTERLGTSPR